MFIAGFISACIIFLIAIVECPFCLKSEEKGNKGTIICNCNYEKK